MMTNYEKTVSDFLNVPLNSADAIFERFSALPNAVVGKGNGPLQRYLYIPGTREDRVVLVAHADTVWDKAYTKPFCEKRSAILDNGVFKSDTPKCGIGADDRAGCAMLWELRNSGHSILITDGEEHGKHGAKFLKQSNRKLFRELNRHRYMIELDWQETEGVLFNQVANTKKFKKYIETELGFSDSKAPGGTDLAVLCRNVCGVNIGVGYHGCHTQCESLVLSEWENTLEKLTEFLKQPQPIFSTVFLSPYTRFAKKCMRKLLRMLKLKK